MCHLTRKEKSMTILLATVRRLKERASTIDRNSRHFDIASTVWSEHRLRKACGYWWFRLPTALLAVGAMLIFMYVIWFFGLILGFQPKTTIDDPEASERSEGPEMFYNYRERKDGTKRMLVPWHFLAIGFIIYELVYHTETLVNGFIWMAILTLIVMAIGGAGFLLWKLFKLPATKQLGAFISSVWNDVCPNLVIVDKKKDETKKLDD